MRWRGVVLLGVLSVWLGGCLDMLARQDSPAPAATWQREGAEPREGDPPTPSMFRFNLGIPSE
jgi:hypothetical protein